MVGSVLDGEDIVQDALFQAYRHLDAFDETRPLSPWLFRIAHHQCIDFLRRRRVRRAAEEGAAAPESVSPAEPPPMQDVMRAIEHLVVTLPPKERACVLLKDVFECSLEETAELVASTLGGVKAALKRGRSKLTAAVPDLARRRWPEGGNASRLRELYVERFNRRDWDGIRELISADARVLVADRFAGPLEGAPYFGHYERLATPWRLASGEVEGEPVVLVLAPAPDGWTPRGLVRLDTADREIVRIVDYTHCPWVLSAARSVQLAGLSSSNGEA